MIVDCISDLHGFYPKLEGGDLLIVAGDFCANDNLAQINRFKDWLKEEGPKYKKTVMVAGNHDNWIQRREFFNQDKTCWDHPLHAYLEDSGTEFMGYRIYGSPWTKTFPGMNPHCMAFTLDTEDALFDKWELIPHDVDILITHSPPLGILDETTDGRRVGSKGLKGMLIYAFRPKLWVYGHIHEGYGQTMFKEDTICVNASHVNERYRPVNPPIRIEL